LGQGLQIATPIIPKISDFSGIRAASVLFFPLGEVNE
jgi:hypothetical protein